MKLFSTRSTLINAALATALVLTVTAASADDTAEGRKDRSHRGFERLDINKDGKITREESRKMAQERFNQTDTNRDGAITQEELKASFEKKKAERQQRPNKKGHAKHDKGKKHHKRGDFFAKIDANKDGKISRSEATKMADQRFARLDKNSDGAVTQEEMRAAHREMKKNRHHKKNEGKSGERQGTDRRQSAQCSPGVQGKKSAKSSSRKDDRGSEVARAERGARF